MHAARAARGEAGRRLGKRLAREVLRTRFALLAGAALAVFSGRWRPLVAQLQDVTGLALGLLAGVVCFLLSYGVIRGAPPGPVAIVGVLGWPLQHPPSPRRVVELGARALAEEAIWRGTLPFLLGGGLPGTLVSAALFTAQHVFQLRFGGRPCSLRQALELFGFSLLLGAAYLYTGRLLLVTGIHWSRNLWIEAGSLRAAEPGSAAAVPR